MRLRLSLAPSLPQFCHPPSEEVMPIKVGINGFGRIGRNIMRTALDDKDIRSSPSMTSPDAKTLAHLLKYDSVLGNLPHTVTHTDDTISVEAKSFKFSRRKILPRLTGPPSARISLWNPPVFSPREPTRRNISAHREESHHLRRPLTVRMPPLSSA